MHPERGQARGQLLGAQPLERDAGLGHGGGAVHAIGSGDARQAPQRERCRLKHGISDRTRVIPCVAYVIENFVQLTGRQRNHRDGEMQADPLGGRRRRLLGWDDLEPTALDGSPPVGATRSRACDTSV